LAESIGEQKDILSQLIILLKNFSQERYIATVVEELSNLKTIYDGITITIERGEPQAVEVDGMLTIVQNETSIVNYTDEQMQAIIEMAEIIRNKLIKQQ
jgi:hypothetical protein